MKQLLFWLLAFATLGAPATAQFGDNGNKASAKLYTKIDGSDVQAVIKLFVDPGWHLYHTTVSEHPDAVGKPLVIELGGSDIAWSTPVVPEPEKKVDKEEGWWVWIHHDTLMIYARGTLAEGATGADIDVTLGGLTCEDAGGTCVSYDETIEPSRFSARHYKAYPADLQAPPAPLPEWKPDISYDKALSRLFVRIEDGTAKAVIETYVAPGWHMYHGPQEIDMHPPQADGYALGTPTTFEFESEGIEWGDVRYPEPENLPVTGFPDKFANQHHGRLYFYVEGKAEEGVTRDDVLVTISGQACDAQQCIPVSEELEPEEGDGPDAVFASFLDAPTVSISGGDDYGTMPLGQFLLLAVFWGLITLLMPCTYPMIPITISFFTKQAIARKGNVLPLSIAYGAGIVLIFILIGVVIGGPIIVFAQHPITNLAIGLLFILFAFVLFGMINLQPPAFLMQFAGKASAQGGIGGVFLMGATLVVTSFTCTAPFVGSLLSVGADGGDITRIILGMGVFGLTMAIPFVILSLIPGKIQAMPSAGEWMNTLKVFLGFVEIAAALKFISNADLVWNWGILSWEIFLGATALIFVGAAIYLSGVLQRGEFKPKVGPVRLFGAVASLAFAAYMGFGFMGGKMDSVTVSLAPPYHSSWGFGVQHPIHTIVKDDWELAIETAISEDKLLLVNFTGVT